VRGEYAPPGLLDQLRDPALDDAYGTWCFGDIELKNARTWWSAP
jgi:hypothetical protein